MPTVAGIDVSKAFLDVAVFPSRERWRTANTPEAAAQLVQELPSPGFEERAVRGGRRRAAEGPGLGETAEGDERLHGRLAT